MDARPVRLAELVGAMSLATDLANGFALEKTLRTTLLAVRLAGALGLDAATTRDVYYAAALRFIGCTGFAAEEAALADGDDIGFRHALLPADGTGDAVGRLWRDLGGSRGHRARTIGRAIAAPGTRARHRRAACDAVISSASAWARSAPSGSLACRSASARSRIAVASGGGVATG